MVPARICGKSLPALTSRARSKKCAACSGRGGQLLFAEHGLATNEGVRRWLDRLTPAWKCISGGCHLNRPIRTLIENAGFRCELIETGYMPGLKPMAFLYE